LGLELDFGPSPSRAEAAAKANAAPAPSPPVPNEKPAAPAPDLTRLAGDVRGVEDASGLGLGLDFSAAQVSSSSANSSASRKSQSPAVASAPSSKAPARGPDRRLLIAGAAFVAIVVAGGLFASGVLGGKPAKTGPARRTQPNDLARQTGPDTTGSDPQYTPTSATTPGPVGLAIPVEAQDGTITNEPDLLNALQRAIGSSGRVLLNNREPIRLSGKDAIVPPVSGGRLYIRAAGGVQPVLEVEVSGKEPFLSTRTRTPITIVGVTIVARYVDQGQPPPPLIEAGAQVTLERCSFRALGAVKGSVAISADGGNLTAAGCWFEGFDKAIDLSVYGEATTRLTHCTIVRPKTDDQPIGWALRVRRQPGSFPKSTRQLTLEHCTFKGEGLLDLIDFSPSTPCKVSINDCAVFADALLAWETSPPGTPLDNQALIWSGTGNQYEIRGKSWVAASSEGTPELTGGPTDLASWMNIGAEHDTIRQPIQFQTDPGALPESPQPSDFAVRAEGNRVVGADPQQVGPPPPKVE
jgi:serine/threonine-protein kinase